MSFEGGFGQEKKEQPRRASLESVGDSYVYTFNPPLERSAVPDEVIDHVNAMLGFLPSTEVKSADGITKLTPGKERGGFLMKATVAVTKEGRSVAGPGYLDFGIMKNISRTKAEEVFAYLNSTGIFDLQVQDGQFIEDRQAPARNNPGAKSYTITAGPGKPLEASIDDGDGNKINEYKDGKWQR